MSTLADKKILVGVSGGIAAYKAAELVRALRKAGAEVRVVMTRGATAFVQPLTFEVLSEHPVGLELFAPGQESEIGHIELARWPDAIVMAPATANLLAKLRVGLADDLLTTLALATTAPVLICPAMNSQMWAHPAVRENIEVLGARAGTTILDPDSGVLACQEVGPGRLPDPDVILAALERRVCPPVLAGRRVLVTAGPTRESIDPVRFLSNPSSGKMGFALAASAWAFGAAEVTLIAGPTSLSPPPGVRWVPVTTAAEMAAAVTEERADFLLMAAAVADYRPQAAASQKRKKTDEDWSLVLERTQDVLATVARSPDRPRVVVGFAAETEHVLRHAAAKLVAKGLDGVVANDVSPGGAFGNDENRVWLLSRGVDEPVDVGPAPKRVVADAIVRWAAGIGGGGADG